MTKQDEIVTEAVARAIFDSNNATYTAGGPAVWESDPEHWRHYARAAITAMRAAGQERVDEAELIELLELAGDYGVDVFNSFPDKTSACALRVEENINRFNAARDRLQPKAPETGEG